MNTKGVLLVLLVISGFGLSGYLVYDRFQLEAQITSLRATLAQREDELEDLQVENSELGDQIEGLNTERERLQTEVENLLEEKDDLQTTLNKRETELTSLQSNYQILEDDYNSLEEAYRLESGLRTGNSLTSFYDALRYEYGLSGAASRRATEKDKVRFAARLALHDTCHMSWPEVEEDYYALLGAHSYDEAWEKLQEALSAAGVGGEDTAVESIEKILAFLSDYVAYELEVDDVYRAPVETLSLRSGDCDDYSILAAALFESVEIESAIGFFKNGGGEAHVMVLVHLEDLGDYDCWYYDELTQRGLSPGRWIIIEPQYVIEYQGDDEWLGQWRLVAASEV